MSATIGQQLRRAREQQGLTLEQAAALTHIRPHYLRALEEGEWEKLPSTAQGRGFLRLYAASLGLDGDALLNASQTPLPAAPTEEAPSSPAQPSVEEPTRPLPLPGDRSTAIFQEVGQHLQERRALLGLSLEEVARQTHLRLSHLQALEQGDMESLPSPVQVRSLLGRYATFLGMDSEQVLLRFAEGLQARLATRQTVGGERKSRPKRPRSAAVGRPRRLLAMDVFLAAGITLLMGVLVLWIAIRIFAQVSAQTPTPTAPLVAEALLATPTPSETPTPPPSPTPPPTFTLPGPEATDPLSGALFTPLARRVQVALEVRQRTWMRVVVDGKLEFEGRALPGSAYTYAANQAVEVLVGSGSAVRLVFNGSDLGPMGTFGQVVHYIYTPQGALFPTPTVTPTAAATPTPAPTQPPSPTPLSATATP